MRNKIIKLILKNQIHVHLISFKYKMIAKSLWNLLIKFNLNKIIPKQLNKMRLYNILTKVRAIGLNWESVNI